MTSRAIYDDDPDAIGRLEMRLYDLEAERRRITTFNKAVRKAGGYYPADHDQLIDEKQRANYLSLARVGMRREDGTFPAFVTSNLSGQVAKTRQRIARLPDADDLALYRGGACGDVS